MCAADAWPRPDSVDLLGGRILLCILLYVRLMLDRLETLIVLPYSSVTFMYKQCKLQALKSDLLVRCDSDFEHWYDHALS